MARNKYYASAHWRALKRACHERDNWRCVVPSCGSADRIVCDHIKTRPNSDVPTSLDTLGNVRTLCDYHDRQVKERADGRRRQGGKLYVKGADASGIPTDPRHHWRQ